MLYPFVVRKTAMVCRLDSMHLFSKTIFLKYWGVRVKVKIMGKYITSAESNLGPYRRHFMEWSLSLWASRPLQNSTKISTKLIFTSFLFYKFYCGGPVSLVETAKVHIKIILRKESTQKIMVIKGKKERKKEKRNKWK